MAGFLLPRAQGRFAKQIFPWRTFERLQARHDALVLMAFTEMDAKLGRAYARLNAKR